MTDRDALYAAVLAAPDDDTPRLVYADYLDDTGARADAIRARFIRNQVALARAEPWSAEYDRLRRATAPVEDHYKKEWAADLEGGFGRGIHFSRGFVAQVTCDLSRFLSDSTRVFDRHPVRAVKFTTARAHGAYPTLAASPSLARLHTLHAPGEHVDDAAAERLAASPHIGGLRCLRVVRSALSIAGLGRLASLTRSGLRELELDEHRAIGEAEVAHLVAEIDGLRLLDLSNITFGPRVAIALAGARALAGLEVLWLGYGANAAGTPLRGPGAVALAESPHLRGLTELDLYGQELRKRGAEAFFTAYAWPRLKRLGLRSNGIPASSIPAFAANPHLRSLREIDFRSNDIKAEDLGPLREACPETKFLTDDTEHPIRLVLLPEDQP